MKKRRFVRFVQILLIILTLTMLNTSVNMAGYLENESWRDGMWIGGSYINGSGEILVKLSKEDRKPIANFKNAAKYDILYIGASRTRNMSEAVNDDKVLFYYAGGCGFRWLFRYYYGENSTKMPAYQVIRAFLAADQKKTVIVDLGGNDLHNINAYLGFYCDLMNKYPHTKFYFMGILPRKIGNETNMERRAFDKRLEKTFPNNTINLFDEVYSLKGFTTVDGTHYPVKQNRLIYQMVMNKIGRDVSVNIRDGSVVDSALLRERKTAVSSSDRYKWGKTVDSSSD